MSPSEDDDDATARAFIAYYLHDVAANAAEDGHPALIEAAAAERTAWEEHGRLEGNTPAVRLRLDPAERHPGRAGRDVRARPPGRHGSRPSSRWRRSAGG
ncbi:hypothetical protein [Streptomyces californicus]|uniref:hypothetical protein n=1 Tax=Streptomyces californicus TaxID=67351 RepID=UPI0033E0F619